MVKGIERNIPIPPKIYPQKISVAQMFACPSISDQTRFILAKDDEQIKKIDILEKKQEVIEKQRQDNEMAIIGISLRTSLANNSVEFWRNISKGLDCIREIPEERKKDLDRYFNYKNEVENKNPIIFSTFQRYSTGNLYDFISL